MNQPYWIKWTDPQTVDEARQKISEEFIRRYYEFLSDTQTCEINDKDFGWKYGYYLTENMKKTFAKDTQKNLIWFQSHIFSGRYLPKWEKEGFNKYTIWALNHDGFLSLDESHSYRARCEGREMFYYISQATAKELRKRYISEVSA